MKSRYLAACSAVSPTGSTSGLLTPIGQLSELTNGKSGAGISEHIIELNDDEEDDNGIISPISLTRTSPSSGVWNVSTRVHDEPVSTFSSASSTNDDTWCEDGTTSPAKEFPFTQSVVLLISGTSLDDIS
jgi:hypothetical protein